MTKWIVGFLLLLIIAALVWWLLRRPDGATGPDTTDPALRRDTDAQAVPPAYPGAPDAAGQGATAPVGGVYDQTADEQAYAGSPDYPASAPSAGDDAYGNRAGTDEAAAYPAADAAAGTDHGSYQDTATGQQMDAQIAGESEFAPTEQPSDQAQYGQAQTDQGQYGQAQTDQGQTDQGQYGQPGTDVDQAQYGHPGTDVADASADQAQDAGQAPTGQAEHDHRSAAAEIGAAGAAGIAGAGAAAAASTWSDDRPADEGTTVADASQDTGEVYEAEPQRADTGYERDADSGTDAATDSGTDGGYQSEADTGYPATDSATAAETEPAAPAYGYEEASPGPSSQHDQHAAHNAGPGTTGDGQHPVETGLYEQGQPGPASQLESTTEAGASPHHGHQGELGFSEPELTAEGHTVDQGNPGPGSQHAGEATYTPEAELGGTADGATADQVWADSRPDGATEAAGGAAAGAAAGTAYAAHDDSTDTGYVEDTTSTDTGYTDTTSTDTGTGYSEDTTSTDTGTGYSEDTTSTDTGTGYSEDTTSTDTGYTDTTSTETGQSAYGTGADTGVEAAQNDATAGSTETGETAYGTGTDTAYGDQSAAPGQQDQAGTSGDYGYDEAHSGASAAGGFGEAPYGPGSAAPAEDGSGPDGWAIKGNAGSMLFHTEQSPSYQGTKAEVWFESEEAARAAGFAHWDRKQR